MKHLLYSGPMAAIYLISFVLAVFAGSIVALCFLGSATAGYFMIHLFQTIGVSEPEAQDQLAIEHF